MKQFKKGDKVVNDIFKTFSEYPYIITISDLDTNLGLIYFNHRNEENMMESAHLRYPTRFEKFFGPIYDFIFK